MSKKLKIITTILLVANCSLLVALPALAAWPATPLLPPCTSTGCCGFNDFILLGINLSKLILSVVGSLALLFFVYGGIVFLLAGGKSEMVEKGKKIITNAVIGIALVLGAWVIVNFTIAALTGASFSNVKIFGTQDWWKTPGAAAPSCGPTTPPAGGTTPPSGGPTTPPAGGTTPPSGGTAGTGGSCRCSGTITTGILADIGDYCDSLRSFCSTCETDRAVCNFTLSVSEAECAELNTAARENNPGVILPHLGIPSIARFAVDINGSCAFSR